MISTTSIAVICFLAVTFVVAGVGMLLRDLSKSVFGAATRGRVRLQGDPQVVRMDELNRRLARSEQGVPQSKQSLQSPIARFDTWFRWLVFDTFASGSGVAAGVLLLLLSGMACGGAAWVLQDDVSGGCVFAALGMLLPIPFLMRTQRIRQQKIQEQLPAALELMSRAVRAGESVDQAVRLCGQRGPAPLNGEFQRCSRQLDFGLSLPAAMHSLGRRLRLADVRIFTAAVAVHREAGGNLAGALERMSAVVRDRMAYRRQLRAATAAGRFSATMVSMAGPLLFAYMFCFQHDYVSRLLTDPLGQGLLAAAILLELIGLTWVIRMQQAERI